MADPIKLESVPGELCGFHASHVRRLDNIERNVGALASEAADRAKHEGSMLREVGRAADQATRAADQAERARVAAERAADQTASLVQLVRGPAGGHLVEIPPIASDEEELTTDVMPRPRLVARKRELDSEVRELREAMGKRDTEVTDLRNLVLRLQGAEDARAKAEADKDRAEEKRRTRDRQLVITLVVAVATAIAAVAQAVPAIWR